MDWSGRDPRPPVQHSHLFELVKTSVPDIIGHHLATYLEFHRLLYDLAGHLVHVSGNADTRQETLNLRLLLGEVSSEMWEHLETWQTVWMGINTKVSQAIFTVVYTLVEDFETQSRKIKPHRIARDKDNTLWLLLPVRSTRLLCFPDP
ncbi:hypothetical protein JCM5353_001100 [Sporobolomyces roseus]